MLPALRLLAHTPAADAAGARFHGILSDEGAYTVVGVVADLAAVGTHVALIRVPAKLAAAIIRGRPLASVAVVTIMSEAPQGFALALGAVVLGAGPRGAARAAPGRRRVRLLTAGPAQCGRRTAQVQLALVLPWTVWLRYWAGDCRHRPADIRRRPRPEEATSEVENLTTRKNCSQGMGRPSGMRCRTVLSVRHLRGWAPQKQFAESTGAPRRRGVHLLAG